MTEQNKAKKEPPFGREGARAISDDTAVVPREQGRLLVPSSLELKTGSLDKYVISKQIARMKEPRVLSPDDLEQRRILHPASTDREAVNRFRELRTRLLELSAGNNFSLVVSSLVEGGGASFVALNLAATFAFDHTKTALLIDCNLREPTLHTQLDLTPDMGLTDFLEDADMDIATVIYPTGVRRLRLIPAGSRRESAAEFFTSFRMKQFLHAVKRRYPDRYIIIDVPDILGSPDARILSELCDYTLLVIPRARVSESQALRAVSAIQPEKLAGVVINN